MSPFPTTVVSVAGSQPHRGRPVGGLPLEVLRTQIDAYIAEAKLEKK